MKIFVQVKTGSKVDKVEQIDDENYKIWVKVPPVEGKANSALVKALASYFKVPKSNIEILSGFKSKKKIVEVII